VQDGPFDRCPNGLACPAQLKRALEHFGSRSALDIAGLGPETVDALVSAGLVRSVADVFALGEDDLVKLEHFGRKSAANLARSFGGGGLARRTRFTDRGERLRNREPTDRLLKRTLLSAARQIAQCDDATQVPVTIDDRNPADLLLSHQTLDIRDVVFRQATVDLPRHDGRDAHRPEGESLRVAAHANVAIGDHADDTAFVIDDRQSPAVFFPHYLGRPIQCVGRRARVHFPGHHFLYVHDVSS
jgi:hypothetical protein